MDSKLWLAWKEAARIFLFSRLLILGITCICILLLPLWIPGLFTWINQGYHIIPSEPLNQLFFSWLRWDVKPYLNISYYGYKYLPDTAFFPLWPLLEHLGGLALGGRFPGSFYLAGLLLANICFYFVLVQLYCLVSQDYGPTIARRTLFYFTFSPFALFFFAGYSEALFMLLCLSAFLALRRGLPLDWWLAGFCCLAASLIRSLGLLLAIPFLVMYIRHFWWNGTVLKRSWGQRINALLPLALIPIGPLLYMFYLYQTRGNPLIFSLQESTVWHRELTFPLVTMGIALQALIQTTDLPFRAGNFINLLSELVFFAALIKGWRSLPLSYSLFALCLALGALCWPNFSTPLVPLISQPRYIMILFPLAIVFALWDKHWRFSFLVRVGTIVFFSLNVGLFVCNVWVA